MDVVLIPLILHSMFYMCTPNLGSFITCCLGCRRGVTAAYTRPIIGERAKKVTERSEHTLDNLVLYSTTKPRTILKAALSLLAFSCHSRLFHPVLYKSSTRFMAGKLTIVYSSVIRLRKFRNGWTRRTSCSNSDSSTY